MGQEREEGAGPQAVEGRSLSDCTFPRKRWLQHLNASRGLLKQ